MKTRFLLSVLLATIVGAAVYASAASLGGLNSGALGAGSANVGSCDSNGFDVTYSLDAESKVTSATVSGIDAACGGGALSLTVTGADGAPLGSASGTVSGSSLNVPLMPKPDPTLVTGVHVAVISQ